MKVVKITNSRTGKTSHYTGFKSDSHAENYRKFLILPEECSMEVIEVPSILENFSTHNFVVAMQNFNI